MMDFEKTFDEEKEFYRNKIPIVCERLEKNNMRGYYAENRGQALEIVKNIVREADAKEIGIADSMLLHQINFFDWLYSDENHFIIHNTFERLEDGRFSEFRGQPNDWIPAEEYNAINRRIWEKSRCALLSDVFLTGSVLSQGGGDC